MTDTQGLTLIGSVKQIDWATKIRSRLDFEWRQGICGLMKMTITPSLTMQANIVLNQAMKQHDAQVWIENRDTRAMYTIADKAGLVGQLRNRLGWSIEEEKAIGREIFDKICDYSVCSLPAFKGNN